MIFRVICYEHDHNISQGHNAPTIIIDYFQFYDPNKQQYSNWHAAFCYLVLPSGKYAGLFISSPELQKRADRANQLVLIFSGRCYFFGKACEKLCYYVHGSYMSHSTLS